MRSGYNLSYLPKTKLMLVFRKNFSIEKSKDQLEY
tara:strand:- start:1583 stop:1687 length:105 start_codon:yes stop_codon:yes gene_type:complete